MKEAADADVGNTAGNVPMAGGVWLVVLAAMLWGTVGVASKAVYGLSDITPLTVGFSRLALAVPLLLLLSLVVVGRRTFSFRGRELLVILLLGVTMAGYQLFYFTAVAKAGVALATLVTICTAPLLVALLSGAVLGERLTGRIALALLLGLCGTLMLVGFPSDVGASRQSIISGVFWAAGSALSYAVFTLCSRWLAPNHHPFTLIAIGFGAGALILLPFALGQPFFTGRVLIAPPASLALLLYIGLVPTALAYVLYFRGMQKTPATVASIASLAEPLTATLLAFAVFGERLGAAGLAGGGLLLASIVILQRGPGRIAAGRARK